MKQKKNNSINDWWSDEDEHKSKRKLFLVGNYYVILDNIYSALIKR